MPPAAYRNLWALTVLCLLHERPMHPYEMQRLIRQRHNDAFLDLKRGSLYHAIERLERAGLIEVVETSREGRRPERTVYRLTESGRVKLDAWMSQLIAEPVKEYPQFEAALSLLPVLHPDKVVTLLHTRIRILEKEIAEVRVLLDAASKAGLPRLLLIEGEYHLVQRETELAWVQNLAGELEAGTLEGLDGWRHVYETGEAPAWDVDVSALEKLREIAAEGGTQPG